MLQVLNVCYSTECDKDQIAELRQSRRRHEVDTRDWPIKSAKVNSGNIKSGKIKMGQVKLRKSGKIKSGSVKFRKVKVYWNTHSTYTPQKLWHC